MFTATEASLAALNLYGISGSTTRLPGEYDCNFHLKADNGNEFLLKISRPDENKAIVDMQNAALQLLHTSTQPFHLPKLQLTHSGELLAEVTSNEGTRRLARLFTFIPGKLLADVHYQSPDLLESLGNQLGRLSSALLHFQHPAARRSLKWDFKQADWIHKHLPAIEDFEDRKCVQYFLDQFTSAAASVLPGLRHSVIHGDMNDYNILVASQSLGAETVSGFIDFGDLVETATICELAIATAYAMLNKPDPVAAAVHVIKGYHRVFPLMEKEINVLFHLIAMRLCMSVVNSAIRKKENPHDSYLTVTEQPAWELLKKLRDIHPRFALYAFRDACGLEPCPQTTQISAWLQTHSKTIGQLFDIDLRNAATGVLDLSPSSLHVDQFSGTLAQMRQSGATVIIGQYNEARLIYSNQQYQTEGNQGTETRTIHLGLDVFMEPDTAVYAPLDSVVHSFADNNQPQDYGPTIILQHFIAESNICFYTLYGHLSRKSLAGLTVGKVIPKGSLIGRLGTADVNGGWIPHLHFQIITDMLDNQGNYPGVAQAGKKTVWLSICPDPNLIALIPKECFPAPTWQKSTIQQIRQRHIGRNVGLSYQSPLQFVRGIGQYLFDENGRKYLDCVNNVCHVGHCHPKVVEAGQKQMAQLNTNTRYLHENLARYSQRLTATLPSPLEVCFFVCSGSEANELALRLARNHTGRNDILVMDHGYHGNTSTLIDISPYKFNGAGGKGKPDFVHVIPMPDMLRNNISLDLHAVDENIAAFICEPLLSCGGQIVLPDQYLQQVYAAVRNAGGVCIADEIQVGLGRVGSHFWGFETQEVVPDIVTMGKPLGNGHPIGAVVTTREIAESFCNGMEYFNTFGGNPVSCAIGLSVLDVIKEENLQQHAWETGSYLTGLLNELKRKYPCIGDVRGSGLFLGIELVTDKVSLAPTKELTGFVVNQLKERGILLSTDGPYQNVIKIKPPLAFSKADCEYLVFQLDCVLMSIDQ